MPEKVQSIEPNDKTGLRNNISEALEHARKGTLRTIVITYEHDDGMQTYYSGGDLKAIGLLEMAKAEVLSGFEVTHIDEYESIDGDE